MGRKDNRGHRPRLGASLDGSWSRCQTLVPPPPRWAAVASTPWELLLLLGSDGQSGTWSLQALWRPIRIVLARYADEPRLYLWVATKEPPDRVPKDAIVLPRGPLSTDEDVDARGDGIAASEAERLLRALRVDPSEIARMILGATGDPDEAAFSRATPRPPHIDR